MCVSARNFIQIKNICEIVTFWLLTLSYHLYECIPRTYTQRMCRYNVRVCVRIYVCMYMCMYTYIYYIYITTFSINDTQHSNAPALCWVSHFIHFHAECFYAEYRCAECRGAIYTHPHTNAHTSIYRYTIIYMYTHTRIYA